MGERGGRRGGRGPAETGPPRDGTARGPPRVFAAGWRSGGRSGGGDVRVVPGGAGEDGLQRNPQGRADRRGLVLGQGGQHRPGGEQRAGQPLLAGQVGGGRRGGGGLQRGAVGAGVGAAPADRRAPRRVGVCDGQGVDAAGGGERVAVRDGVEVADAERALPRVGAVVPLGQGGGQHRVL